MQTLIYFTRELPGISEELSRAGFLVYEGLATSEVFFLAEQHPTVQILVDHTAEEEAARRVAQHHVTVHLNAKATVADVIWELAALSRDARVH